jgi:hypothetical protein
MDPRVRCRGVVRVSARLLVVPLAAFVAGSTLLGPTAAHAVSDVPCAHVEIDYFPTRVEPGGLAEMSLVVENCSPHDERILLDVQSSGPCRFFHPEVHVYKMEAGIGFAVFALFVAPECVGAYRVTVAGLVKGKVLDVDRAGFNVLARLGSE